MPAYAIKHRSPKSWHKITIQVDSRMSDAVAAYLAELTGTGLEISSPDNSQTRTAHTFPTEKITGYLPIGPQESDKKGAHKKITGLQQFLSKACHIFPDCHAPQLQTETILEEDWGETWKSFFTSFQITPTLTIKPSWEVVEEQERTGDANKAVIEMDPGLAFGTGHHASTQLALLLLEELFQNETEKPEKILDVGTGSGILAMACGLFGAREVLALDNDPDAVETATQNILRNHLEDKISISGQEVSSIKAGFDLVVANITHDTLADLAKLLTRLINPRGVLVLSGILKGEQEHSISDIYTKYGLVLIKNVAEDEWTALQFQKT